MEFLIKFFNDIHFKKKSKFTKIEREKLYRCQSGQKITDALVNLFCIILQFLTEKYVQAIIKRWVNQTEITFFVCFP